MTWISDPPPKRSGGLLLHPTSLPGRLPIGDLGFAAHRFLDWLRSAGQTWWQILPLGPPEGNHSPYSCLSAFAGNPLLISPELLADEGLLAADDFTDAPASPPGRVDFEAASAWKEGLLRRSWDRDELREEREAFAEQQEWLDDWTLFAALRRRYASRGWWEWDDGLARRDAAALDAARRELAEEIDYEAYVQFLFFRQWGRLRAAAHERGVAILGDLPIYVAWNSAEVWARPDLFELDDRGHPLGVAGVPPDYFSDTGQLWGNPLYRWDRMAEDGYAWWIDRLKANLELTDRVRLDHFRAFASYWRVPFGDDTAIDGEWREGPRLPFFEALRSALDAPALGALPLIAEDLGDMTPDVGELLAAVGLPGIRVLQFGFDDPASIHAPHHLVPRCAVYTGTHDNDTTAGWYASLDDEARARLRDYGIDGDSPREVAWSLVRSALSSVAELAVVPLQDILGKGAEARMNTPSVAAGNWSWRLGEGELDDGVAARLRRLTELSDRAPS